jgi:hypothetical protein
MQLAKGLAPSGLWWALQCAIHLGVGLWYY